MAHKEHGPITIGLINQVLRWHVEITKIINPTLNYFRRAFTLSMLRCGTVIFTLSKLIGHEVLMLKALPKSNIC